MNLNQTPEAPDEQQKINVADLPQVKCQYCQAEFFESLVAVRRVSPLLSGTGKEEYLQIPVLVCAKCSKPLERTKIVTA